MILRVELPKLICKTKGGKELYLDPLTNELVPIEKAYSGYECIKNESAKKVYHHELGKKTPSSKEKVDVNFVNDTNGVNIYGRRSQVEPETEEFETIDEFFRKLKRDNPDTKNVDRPKENPPLGPYQGIINLISRLFSIKRNYFDDMEADMESEDKNQRGRSKKKRLKYYA